MSLLSFLSTTIIEIPGWGDVSIIEAIWDFIGAASAAIILYSLYPVYVDWRNASGILRPIAGGYFRREVIRLVQAIAVLGIGIYASLTPPAFHNHDYTTPTGIVLTFALFVIGVGIGLQSFLDKRLRSHLLGYLESQDEIQQVDLDGSIEQEQIHGHIEVDAKEPLSGSDL